MVSRSAKSDGSFSVEISTKKRLATSETEVTTE
jgi:hypothetical protein